MNEARCESCGRDYYVSMHGPCPSARGEWRCATDCPHHHFDDPERVAAPSLGEGNTNGE